MSGLAIVVVVLVVLGFRLSLRIVQRYERGVLFRLGRVVGVREPGLAFIVPLIDILRRVPLRIVGGHPNGQRPQVPEAGIRPAARPDPHSGLIQEGVEA
jgi:regulator of protease activity HflC (stomatin/prohibitin superfamily)